MLQVNHITFSQERGGLMVSWKTLAQEHQVKCVELVGPMRQHFKIIWQITSLNIAEGQTYLIISDGHKSCVSYVDKLRQRAWHCILYSATPNIQCNSTLGSCSFGPLKAMYNIECQTYMRQNPGHTINN